MVPERGEEILGSITKGDRALGLGVRTPVYGFPAFLFAIALILGAAYVVAQHVNPYGVAPGGSELSHIMFELFDLDSENNIPTWYSSLLWAIAARTALVAAGHAAGDDDGVARRSWTLLGWIFLLLSLDEVASLHERLLGLAGDSMGLAGSFYYSWVVLAGLLAVGVAGALAPFVLRVRRDVAACLVVAAALFLGGALGVETLSSAVNLGSIASVEQTGLTWVRMVLLEELMEMMGPIIAIHAALRFASPVQELFVASRLRRANPAAGDATR